MVTMRIHGATTDFMKEVGDLGYDHPSVDQLVYYAYSWSNARVHPQEAVEGDGQSAYRSARKLENHGIVE